MKHTNPQVEQMTSFIVVDVLENVKEGLDRISRYLSRRGF